MITLKRILVPQDGTESETAATNCAVALAKISDATCDVLHATKSADADGIVRDARDKSIDLIVIGTHRRGGLARAVRRCVAEKVVRRAPCPVLTVPTAQHDLRLVNILVPTDFGAASTSALLYGRTLARVVGANLHLVHVMENYFMRAIIVDRHKLTANLHRQLVECLTDADRADLHATVVLEVSDHPAQEILQYANRAHIDLIVMGTHGRLGTERLLLGSVAERLVRTASCPVLTLHHPEREFIVPDAGVAGDTFSPSASAAR